MHNRLQHYPPPPNIKPTRRPTPVAAVEAAMVPAKAKPPLINFRPAHLDVAIRAYYIFIHEGARHGSDIRHWLEAELQLITEHQAA